MSSSKRIILFLIVYCWLVEGINEEGNETSIQNVSLANAIKFEEFAENIKLYLKKFQEEKEQFSADDIKGKEEIETIENDARMLLEAIRQMKKNWYGDDDESMSTICGMP